MDERKKSEGNVHDNRFKPLISFQDIESRVVDVEGTTFLPRRGVVQQQVTEPRMINVIDELTKITLPVDLGFKQDHADELGGNNVNKKGLVIHPDQKDNQSNVQSYAEKLATIKPNQKVNFRFMENSKAAKDVDVTIPIASVRQVQDRFANVLFGYFLGKRLAFPVVEY